MTVLACIIVAELVLVAVWGPHRLARVAAVWWNDMTRGLGRVLAFVASGYRREDPPAPPPPGWRPKTVEDRLADGYAEGLYDIDELECALELHLRGDSIPAEECPNVYRHLMAPEKLVGWGIASADALRGLELWHQPAGMRQVRMGGLPPAVPLKPAEPTVRER